MKYRIFSKPASRYVDESYVSQDGVVFFKDYYDHVSYSWEPFDPREVVVEPFTGFYDSKGQKIFVGDIIRIMCFDLDYEVVWHQDRFAKKALYDIKDPDYNFPFNSQEDLSNGWEVVGNKHQTEGWSRAAIEQWEQFGIFHKFGQTL